MNSNPIYSNDRDFQVRILAVILRDPKFIDEYNDVIKSNYFEYGLVKDLCKLVLDYYNKYNTRPTRESLENITMEYCSRFELQDKLKEGLLDLIHELYLLDIVADCEYIKEKVVKFSRFQEYKLKISEAIDIMDMPNLDELDKCDKIDGIFDSLRTFGTSNDIGLDFAVDALPEGIQKLKERGPLDIKRKVGTFIKEIDSRLFGGLGAGELGILTADTGKGKSTILVNFAAVAMFSGKTVIYITTELGEGDILVKFGVRLTGLPQEEVIAGSGLYNEKITSLLKRPQKLFIKKFTSRSTGVRGVKSYISMLCIKKGVKPDLIILDSWDYLKCDHGFDTDLHTKGDYMASDLIALGEYFQCPVWTANHVNATGKNVDLVNGSMAGGSIRKVANCDVHITVNQTIEEAEDNICRLYLDKVRRGKDKFIVKCIFNKEQQLLKSYEA